MWVIVVQLIPGKNPNASKLCFSCSFCVSFCLKGDGLQDDTFNFERAFDPNLFVCVCVCASVCVCVLVRLVSLCLIHLFISSDSTIVVTWLSSLTHWCDSAICQLTPPTLCFDSCLGPIWSSITVQEWQSLKICQAVKRASAGKCQHAMLPTGVSNTRRLLHGPVEP
jgi:hypothetical protein